MMRVALLAASIVGLSCAAADAACVGRSGQSLNGKVWEYEIGPKRSDFNRFVRMTPGRHTVQVSVIDRSGKIGRCSGNDRGLEFDIGTTPNGEQLRCRPGNEEGPGAILFCQLSITKPGRNTYYVRMRNPGCRTITYELVCKNGFIEPAD
jgi:hypothetical protein